MGWAPEKSKIAPRAKGERRAAEAARRWFMLPAVGGWLTTRKHGHLESKDGARGQNRRNWLKTASGSRRNGKFSRVLRENHASRRHETRCAARPERRLAQE